MQRKRKRQTRQEQEGSPKPVLYFSGQNETFFTTANRSTKPFISLPSQTACRSFQKFIVLGHHVQEQSVSVY